jgi:hypothetical protein
VRKKWKILSLNSASIFNEIQKRKYTIHNQKIQKIQNAMSIESKKGRGYTYIYKYIYININIDSISISK